MVNMNEENEMKRKREEIKTLSREELLDRLERLERQNEALKEKLLKVQAPGIKGKIKKNLSEVKPKKPKKFDFSRYNTRHIALKIAYLGWDYHGFASQENIENTIEAHLFNALLKACLIEERATCNYSRCGRTDKGVSAFGQVISLHVRTNLQEGDGIILKKDCNISENSRTDSTLEEINYVYVLNKLLPDEIQVLAWTPVALDFKARFSCVHREYKYYFPAGDMDIERMDKAAQKFLGEHDFRNFCKMDVGNNVTSFYRNVLSVKVERNDNCESDASEYNMCVITVCGMAFLWHQVRCMTSILMLIGQHLEEPQLIDDMLDIEKYPRRPQYNMASELPLVLFDCKYDDLEWIYHSDQLKIIFDRFQKLWTTSCTKTTMMKSLLDNLDKVLVSQSNVKGGCNVSWCDKRERLFPGMSLIPGHHVKSYKKILARALCDSLETKLENLSAKRKRLENKE